MYREEDKELVQQICSEWSKRTRMDLDYIMFEKIIQKDVNNYIMIPSGNLYDSKGKARWKSKGSYVKKLSRLDNDLPIVNRAIVNYFLHNIPVEETINGSDKLIDFQKITKISRKYDYASHNGKILHERVHRCFASLDPSDGTLYKKHRSKETLDKTPSTPVNCYIDNGDVTEKKVPQKLDRQWYIDLAKQRIKDFIG